MADEDDDKQPLVYEDDEPEGNVFRWMSAVVVLLAIAGFFGLAWYAYRNGGDTIDEKDVELVKADKTPVKEQPANPGGMQIPNQDKTVYGLIAGKPEKPVVERILPAPEEPMPRASGNTETWMSSSLKGKTSTDEDTVKMANADGTPMTPADTGTPPPTPAPKEQFNPAKHAVVTPTPTPPAAVPAATPATPAVPAAPVVAAQPPAPTIAPVTPVPAQAVTKPAIPPAPAAAVKPAVTAKPAAVADNSDDSDDDSDKKADAKPAQPAATPPAGTRVQLGSYKSQNEAESNWTKIAHKFSDDVGGKQHYVVRADLGSKGVYYRLQLSPFGSSAEAEEFCLNFVSAGQGCIVAKGK